MKLKLILSLIIFGTTIGNILNAQQKWSLNQCISYAIENNIKFRRNYRWKI